MNAVGAYDKDLQMYVEPARDPRPEVLRFVRWLAEQDRLEHPAYSPPAGDLAYLVWTEDV